MERTPPSLPERTTSTSIPYGENEEVFAKVVRTGEPYYAYSRAFEYADSPERGVSYWDWTLVPTKEGDGKVTGLLFSLANVTDRIQMELSLRVSEEKYRLLVETVGSVIVVTQDGLIKFINDRVEDLLGYSPDEIVGAQVASFLSEEETQTVRDRTRARVSGKEPPPKTYRLNHKNGDVRYMEINGTVMAWEGRPALLSFITDVTDRTIAEEALRESERRYHSLFQSMLEGFAYHEMIFDSDWRPVDYTFLEANDAFERLTGLQDVVGKRVSEIIPAIREENPELFEIYGRVALSGATEEFETYVPALNRWFSVSVYSPRKGYFVTVFDNITERKLAEEQLKEAHQNLKLTLKAGNAGTWDWDIANNTFVWSEEFRQVFGMDSNTPAGFEAWTKAVHPEDRESSSRKIRDSIDKREDLTNDYRIILPGGQTRWIRAIGKTFYDGSTPVRMTGLCIDITDRKRAEETLREAQQLSEGLNRINEILHSSLDMGHIVRNLVDEGAAMLGSESAALSLRLAGHWTVAHVHGLPDSLVGSRMSDHEERHAELALESRRPLAIADALTDKRVDRRHMKKHGIRAVLVAPLIVRNEPFGAIFFNQHTAPREFSDAQVDFSAQLASTAAIALENSRLYDERRRAEEELRRSAAVNTALAELYEPLTSPGATIPNIAQVVLRKALELTGSAHGFVAEIDPISADNMIQAITNMFPKYRKAQGQDYRLRFPRGTDGRYGGLWGHALNTREAFFTNRPETHPSARGVPKGHDRIQRFLSVPVLLGSELVGQIALANPDLDYSERDMEAVQRLAEFYALAIQRVRAEETILQSLNEKEALLREIHHRVKNNLQTVSSLLAMSGMGTKSKEAADLLHDAESRVHAMALIHSQLYGSKQLDRVDVKRNIRELTDRLSSIYSASSHHIAHSVEGDDVSLTIHQAIPAALAINEIVTNAFKYAFEGKKTGVIKVVVGRKKDRVTIAIADDGIGLPDGFDVESADTLGVRLVKNLIEGQLGGRVDFASSGGSRVTMSFEMEGNQGSGNGGSGR